jgi:hypothetical protein
MAQVTELITAFKFEGSTKPLESFNQSLGKSATLLLGASTALLAAGAGIATFAKATLQGIDSQLQLADSIGVTIEQIQKLGFAAESSGSSAQDLESSLVGLTDKAGEAALKGSEAFNRLGINVRKSNGEVKKADQLLLEISDQFKGLNLSVAEQSKLLSELGINKNLAKLLGSSRRDIRALMKEAKGFGIVSEENARRIEEFNTELYQSSFAFDSLKKLISIGLLPQLKSMNDSFQGFLKTNQDVIVNGIQKFFKGIGALVDAFKRVGGAIGDLIDKTIGFKAALIAVTALIIKFNSALLLNPIVLITGLIVGLVAVVDDLVVAFQGGKSIIGDFFKSVFNVSIVEAFTKAIDFLKDSLKSLIEFFDPLVEGFNNTIDRVAKVGKFLGIDSLFNNLGSGLDNLITGGQSSNVSNSTNQDVTININTSDPVVAGEVASQALKREFDLVKGLNNRGNF